MPTTCAWRVCTVMGLWLVLQAVLIGSVRAQTVPGAPTIGAATAGDGQISVAFTPPASDGGSAITQYTATCGSESASGASSPIVVTGLANGTAYTCTVTATNAVGTGPASAPSNSVTPECAYVLTPLNQGVDAGAVSGQTVTVTAGTGCAWTASSDSPWLNITSGNSGSGSGTVTYSVQANAGPNPRRGDLTVAGELFQVSQTSPEPPPCTVDVPTSVLVPQDGGAQTLMVTASTSTCRWSIRSAVEWITITSATSGMGNGVVQYNVETNIGNARKGRLSINGQRITVSQP
ncbi:MAG: BACON domain-containing carbohydrate-binding protein [Candidatus Binatia bacterium]